MRDLAAPVPARVRSDSDALARHAHRVLERALATLAEAGLHEPAHHAMRAVVAYVTGAVLREIETTPHLGGVPMNAHDSAIDPA
jgi:hypothetical protein